MRFLFLFSLFYYVDLFQSPVILKFEKREKNSTILGIILSIGIIIFLVDSFAQSDVFLKQLPTIVNMDVSNPHRPKISYSKKLFAISITDLNNVAVFDPSMFQIQIANIHLTGSQSGKGFDYSSVQIKTSHLCNFTDVEEKMFISLGLNGSFCLDENFFETEGYWDDDTLKYLEINVTMCDNSTFNNSCKTPQEIADYLTGMQFNVYYVGTNLDPSNYLSPTNSIIYNDFYFIDSTLRKNLNIFLKNLELITDDGFLESSLSSITDILFDTKELDIFYVQDVENTQPLFQCYFYSSRLKQNVQRFYQKILDALSNLGGTASIVMMIGAVLVMVENSFSLSKKIMNSLYAFQDDKLLEEKVASRKASRMSAMGFSIRDNLEVYLRNGTRKRAETSNHPKKTITMTEIVHVRPIKETIVFKKQDILDESDKHAGSNDNLENLDSPLKDSGSLTQRNEEGRARNVTFNGLKIENLIIPEKNPAQENDDNNIVNIVPLPRGVQSYESIEAKSMISRRDGRQPTISRKIQNLEKLDEFQKNSSKISQFNFNLFDYLKMNIKFVFRMPLNEKEKLFLKGSKVYDNELDIVHILKKLQEFEKLKIILLNEEQRILFNLIGKPLIYLEDNEHDDFDENCSAQLKMSKMIRSATTIDEPNLKKALGYFSLLQKNNQLNPVEKRLMELVDKNLSEFLQNFT